MEENSFLENILQKIEESRYNNYTDNYDEYRFGKFPEKRNVKQIIKKYFIFPKFIHRLESSSHVSQAIKLFFKYSESFTWLYNNLRNEKSKKLLVDILVFRILGYRHIKLDTNNDSYWNHLEKVKKLIINKNDFLDTDFLDWKLFKFDTGKIGYDLVLYYTIPGIVVNFISEQYAYKDNLINISVNEGDVVIDAGACWGDTALYFASKVKELGKVYSFEFIPKNIEIFNLNMKLNSEVTQVVKLIENPLWDEDERDIFFIDRGPGSIVQFDEFENYSGKTKTVTIDNFVKLNNIEKVNFIKMDIEGSELFALNGAINTIKKFKPKLAIAIYHSMDDFTQIPKWIHDLDLGYKLYLGHYTIHSEETIIFASV